MKPIYLILLAVVCMQSLSCQKEFLDKKPNKALLVPSKLADLQSLLDNTSVMNVAPALHTIAADDYTLSDNALKSFSNAYERNSYLWTEELYEGKTIPDWYISYEQIFYANVVLEGLKKIEITAANEQLHNRLKGSALFYRAVAHYHLAQLFAIPYQASAESAFGIPYRTSADVNERTVRSTLKNTYQMILNDFNEAKDLLPSQAPYKGGAGKPAALAYLARIHLLMGAYQQALDNAEQCLATNNKLIDFNLLNPSSTRPISGTNEETLFYTIMFNYSFVGKFASTTLVDVELFKSYDAGDLRKTVFFNNKGNDNVLFKGNYTGSSAIFAGIATDEVYLIKAECQARIDNKDGAMATLNQLLEKRWDKTKFTALSAVSNEAALKLIIAERRKELISRGVRWTDLRRLNQDERFTVTLKRNFEGHEYILRPGDNRYVFPIPDDEMRLNIIEQNPR